MKGSVKLPVFIDDARKYVNTTQLRAKYLGASYEAEYCQWQALHGLGSLMETASLIITPNAFLEGKLIASYPPDPIGDFTVTRATTATRVNSSGLVELVPYNLLSYSEQLNNASWAKVNTSVTANTTNSPDGTTNADSLIENTATNLHLTYQFFTSTATTYTYSCYIKPDTRTRAYLRTDTSVGTVRTLFDLTGAGSVVTLAHTSATITLINGWYRCTITFTEGTGSGSRLAAIEGAVGTSVSYLGNGLNAFYLWGAQLVEGSTAKDYQKTETRLNIPRLDYSNGACPSLLVEPQRTNLVRYSEQFDNAANWNNENTTDTANQEISPDGTQNADKVNANAVNTFHRIYNSSSIIASTPYTFSVYVKKNTLGFIQLALNNGFTTNYLLSPYANFNLTTGVVSQSGNGATAKIESLANGWYRCSISSTSIVAATSGEYNINLINSGTLTAFQSWTGSTSDSLYLWGAQLEAGSYASSYIPTTTASVTRNYDIPFLGNNYTSGRISASGGTWFTHLINNIPITRDSGGGVGLRLSNTTFNNTLHISTPGGSNQRYWIRKIVGGTNTNLYHTLTNEVKIAIKWNGTTADVFVNGVKVVSATAFTSVDLENLGLDNGNIPYNINSMALWSTPLTDTQLAQLTTI